MKRRVLRLLTILTLSAAALSVTAWSSAIFNNQQGKDVEDLFVDGRLKTLRERAQERDIEVISECGVSEYSDLPSMARGAHTIVLGRILDAEASFEKDDNHINTTYSVDVQQVLKANAPLTLPLKFICFGGVVNVNGHRVTVKKVEGLELLRVDKDYALFLEWIPRHQTYLLTGGMSGAFLINNGSRVTSLASSELKLKYSGTDLEALIQEVLANQ